MSIDSREAALRRRLLPGLIQLLRAGRRYSYRALAPVDYFYRVLNNKASLPPMELRRYVGDLGNFEGSGAEFAAYLKLIAAVRPDERVLDLGCGCGAIALHLLEYIIPSGSYVGLDVDEECIRWCQRNITPRNERFTFQALDLYNDVYRPKGKQRADGVVLPFGDGCFDVIVLKSVFTHLNPPEVDRYLHEVGRLLSGHGRCLATFFLFNSNTRPGRDQRKPKLNFESGNDVYRCQMQECPGRATGYSETYIRDLAARHGLSVDVHYSGGWSGRREFLSFQDVLLLRKTTTVGT